MTPAKASAGRSSLVLKGIRALFTTVVLGLTVPATQAAEITNTAFVNWPANPFVTPSNKTGHLQSNGGIPVTFFSIPKGTPSELTFYQYSPTGQCATSAGTAKPAQQILFNNTLFKNASGDKQSMGVPYALAMQGASGLRQQLDISQALSVCEASVIHADEPIFITLKDANRNLDPASAESILINLTSSSGDVIQELTLQETGPNTGVFSGYVLSQNVPNQTQSSQSSLQPNDGVMSVGADGWVRGDYKDIYYPDDTSTDSVLVDPYGIVFDSKTGLGINDAKVWIVDRSLPGCSAIDVSSSEAALDSCQATVYMDDGVSAHPAKMTTGISIPGNPVVPTGGYRFPLMAPGSYALIVHAPTGYSVPSSMIPACAAGPCANPFGLSVVNGSHTQDFIVAAGPALHIDIPADAVTEDLLLTKTVSSTLASVGDFLKYTLTLSNRGTVTTLSGSITDVLPRGFRYQSGSLHINGVKQPNPTISNDGRMLTIDVGAIAGNSQKVISYVTAVSADAVIGDAVNTAVANGPLSSRTLTSNRAQVAVRISEPLMSGRFTLIGRVFESECHAGWEEFNRKGVANARIMLEDGTYVLTDSDGYYHIEGLKPGTHVVQLDSTTLTNGRKPVSCIDNTRFAGNAYSQFVDVRGGGLWRADFIVTPPEAVVEEKIAEPEQIVVIPSGEAGIRLKTLADVEVTDVTEAIAPRSYSFYGRFDSGKHELLPASVNQLKALAADLKKGRVLKLEVLGHTDSQGLSVRSKAVYVDNHGLGLARANTVADYLAKELGLKPEDVTTEGIGPDRPLATNNTADGRAKNRRVEVIVYGAMGPDTKKVGERSRRTHQLEIDSGTVASFNLRAEVSLPLDLDYVKGSSALDGKPLADPFERDGVLTWKIPAYEGMSAVSWTRAITFNTDVVTKRVETKAAASRQLTFSGKFEPAQAELMTESVSELENLLEQLRQSGSIDRLEVVGHTDNQRLSARARQRFPDNSALSLARANTIANFLSTGLGLSGDQIEVIGKGESEPVGDNKTADGRAANRRVVVNVFVTDAAQSRLRKMCDGGYVSLKASALLDTEATRDLRLPTVENRFNCAGVNDAQNVASLDQAVSGDDSGRQSQELRPFISTTESAQIVEKTVEIEQAPATPEMDEVKLAGGNIDWLSKTTGEYAILFPSEGHNPRAPAIRVVVAHKARDQVELRINGEEASALNFEGTNGDLKSMTEVSIWRGLPLKEGPNRIAVRIRDSAGTVIEEMVRTVYFSNTPTKAELVAEKSVLIADGVTTPVIAVRFLDRHGQPVRHGVTGALTIRDPHLLSDQVEQTQKRQLAGLERYDPQYRVEGEEGIALIKLAPTSQSGSAQLNFKFEHENETSRQQEVKAWLQPSVRDWVMVGFAEGTLGYNTLKDNIAALRAQNIEDGVYTDGQVSFYVKGAIKGEWLLTMAYDSDKKRERESLLSVIDPNEYYTLYGDGSEQRYDAASQSKLYLKLERGQFYALFGDYETGLDDNTLSRYSRTLNGLKAEKADGLFVYKVFAAETDQNYSRDEIRGNGTSGLYRLNQRNIVINSEIIRLQVRDRLHSNTILETRTLSRHLDYDIDYSAGTLFFKQPINANDTSFNPQWIVAEYETMGRAERALNVGGRIGVNVIDNKLQVGVTALRDESNSSISSGKTELLGTDLSYQLGADTELRLELAGTRGEREGNDRDGSAWLAELEHHSGRYDVLVYSRSQEDDFGLDQQNLSEAGQQKTGVSGSYLLDRNWSVQGELFKQENRGTDAKRQAAAAKVQYENDAGVLSAGVQLVEDSADRGVLAGQTFASELLVLEASRWFLDRRFEVSAQAEVGEAESSDYPNRLALNGSYKLNNAVSLIAGQEFADGSEQTSARTRAGLQVEPWAGARLNSTLNQNRISEYGPRTFAQFGLAQNILINQQWSVDFNIDSSQSVDEKERTPEINNSSSTSNLLGLNTSTVTEDTDDYIALSAGATYRTELWSLANRVETRDGDTEDRYGITSNFLRQAQSGVAFASGFDAFNTDSTLAGEGSLYSLDLALAWRPLGSQWSILNRLEFKYETAEASDELFGFGSLNAQDATSRRVINNLAINRVSREWNAEDRKGNLFQRYERNQWSLYYGAKYVQDTFDGIDYSGYTDMYAFEVRHDLRTYLDIGLQASVLNSWGTKTHAYSFGPQIGLSPIKNGWVTFGWNIRGFTDDDFDAARYSAQGPYLQLRFKFDQNTRLNRELFDSQLAKSAD